MEEEELVCRPEVLACSAEHADGEHDAVTAASHALHGAHLVHAVDDVVHHHATPRATPGTGGPTDPAYWTDPEVTVAPARGGDLDDIMCALGEEAVREEAALPRVPARAPISPDASTMLDDLRAGGADIPETGTSPATSPAREELEAMMRDTIAARRAARPAIPRTLPEPRGPGMAEYVDSLRDAGAPLAEDPPLPGVRADGSAAPFDPAVRPVRREDIVYPPRDGAAGEIVETTIDSGTTSRIGSPTGGYGAIGDPSIESRALPPDIGFDGEVPFASEYHYRVARPFPAEVSEAAEAFGMPGGATQFRAPVSHRALEAGGYLELESGMEVRYADFEETAEIMSAVAEERAALAATPPALREPISPDMATMCDDIAAAQASDAAALDAATPPVAPLTEAPLAPAAALDDAAAGAGAASHVTPVGAALGTLGAVAGGVQIGEGLGELANGDTAAGIVDVGAGGVGTATGLAATGLLGEGAAAAVAAPPVALGAALVGAAAAGDDYNREHATFGTDEDGEGISALEFAYDSGADAYHGIHDAIAAIDPDSDVADGAGMIAGGIGGGLVGLGAGVVGLGGDLRYGVPEVIGGLYDLATGYGDEYWQRDELWGAPTVDAETGEVHHVSSREMIEDSAHGAFDTVHDGIMGVTGDEGALGVVGEVAGTTLGVGAGALVGLGGGLVGGVAALGGTIDRAATDLWSWMTD